ncbi:hypothetical protein DOTSEDRAFT_43888 [Dothistroma septosporum NZE10]|uniref:Uncharacterized protein n=1 Tax=Dothistroma septosporum (strain NZE10 / CBS 128990) TaxID=675120 RepID=N1PT99_DOTSN|nr:hypothetical protein DOTSEDRAFT_43888 [Dothistroma septosporum NZE10]
MHRDFLDMMTITSITANTFDSHSDTGSVNNASQRSSTTSLIDELQDVAEISASNKTLVSYHDLLRHTNGGLILRTLHGFPYINDVNDTDLRRRTSTNTTSTIASTRGAHSSIQTEEAFTVRRMSGRVSFLCTSSSALTDVDMSRPHTATSNNEEGVLQARITSVSALPSSPARSRHNFSFSEDISASMCGCRALITALCKRLARQKSHEPTAAPSIHSLQATALPSHFQLRLR